MTDYYLEAADFLTAMEGRSLTGKWDILVSYHCQKLNDLLSSLWKLDEKTDTAEFIRDQQNSYNTFKLRLGTPKLSFEAAAQEGFAVLSIPIDGTLTTTYRKKIKGTIDWIDDPDIDPDKVVIPEGQYELRVKAPLRSVQGDSINAQAIDDSSGGSGKVIHLGDKQHSSSDIVLQLSHHSTQYTFESVTEVTHAAATSAVNGSGVHVPVADLDGLISTNNDKIAAAGYAQTALNDAIDGIRAWFVDSNNVDSIKYRLATVKAQESTDNNAIFKPKSFVFTTSGDVLCIYIQTQGSGNPQGDTDAKFTKLDGSEFRPMPKGATASIIIRHDLFREKVLLPQLKKYHSDRDMSDNKLPRADIENMRGFKFDFWVHGDYKAAIQAYGSIMETTTVHGFNINLDAQATSLVIEDNKAKWSFDHEYKVHCHRKRTFGFGEDYNVYIRVMADQTTNFATIANNSELNTDFSLKSSAYSTSIRAEGEIPSNLNSLDLAFTTTTLKTRDLSIVAAQSLLAPGATVMDVKSVHTPYDVVLIGNLRGKL